MWRINNICQRSSLLILLFLLLFLFIFLEFTFVYFHMLNPSFSYFSFFLFFSTENRQRFIHQQRGRNTTQRSRVDTLCSSVPAGQRPGLHPPRVRNFNGHSVLTYIQNISPPFIHKIPIDGREKKEKTVYARTTNILAFKKYRKKGGAWKHEHI